MSTRKSDKKDILLGLRVTRDMHDALVRIASEECLKPKAVFAARKLIREGIMRRACAPKRSAK